MKPVIKFEFYRAFRSCGAIPEGTIDSELFCHENGSSNWRYRTLS